MTSFSRREFLQASLLLGAGATFGHLPLQSSTRFRRSSLRAPRTAIVLGAGLSGLSAAWMLRRNGWDVVVLEARNRIGGRVWTQTLPENRGLTCEVGGEWVGASHERIQQMCRAFGITLDDHRFAISLLRDGEVSKPKAWKFSPQAEHAWKKLANEYSKLTQRGKEDLDKVDWWTCLRERGFNDDDLRLRDLMDSTDFGESIRFVSAFAAASEYFESSPNNEMDFRMRGGNSRLVNELARRVGIENIRLNLPVRAVTQKNGHIWVRAGKDNEYSIRGDACICTLPGTALRDVQFSPALPSRQQQAMRELNYARIIKSPILYEERFWKTNDYSLVSDRTSHYFFHSTKNQAGKQGVLTSYVIGDKADVLASQNHRVRRQMIAEDLRVVDERAPELVRGGLTYAWHRDQLTRGAYALYRPGQWFGLRPILQQPHGKVLFAGEHLADWQGFMEGAINTGEEAASMLLGK
jgi:monoamine oxidase